MELGEKKRARGVIGSRTGFRFQREIVRVRVSPSPPNFASSSLALGTTFLKQKEYMINPIDTDKCVENIGNRFNLVLAATIRVRELKRGHRKLVAGDDGYTITALREIEAGLVGIEMLRKIR